MGQSKKYVSNEIECGAEIFVSPGRRPADHLTIMSDPENTSASAQPSGATGANSNSGSSGATAVATNIGNGSNNNSVSTGTGSAKAAVVSANNADQQNPPNTTKEGDNGVAGSEDDGEDNTPKEIIASRVCGTVKWFNVKAGYGFINRNDTKEDVFVHQTAIALNNPKKAVRSVGDGEVVEFDVVVGKKGNEASNVTGPEGLHVKGSPYAADRRRANYRRGGSGGGYYPYSRGGGGKYPQGNESGENAGSGGDSNEAGDGPGEERSDAAVNGAKPRGAGGRGRGGRGGFRSRYIRRGGFKAGGSAPSDAPGSGGAPKEASEEEHEEVAIVAVLGEISSTRLS